MNLSKRKHILLIALLLLIAGVSTGAIMEQGHTEKRSRIAVVFPEKDEKDLSALQEGIRDYAFDRKIKLDVWYKEKLSNEELSSLVQDEKKNDAVGVLLIYPELYLEHREAGYQYDNVLALTDTRKQEFKYSAAFAEEAEQENSYRLPVKTEILRQLKDGKKENIYVENTYKMGYKCMQMIGTYGQKKQMHSIRMKAIRIGKKEIENGEYDALFAE